MIRNLFVRATIGCCIGFITAAAAMADDETDLNRLIDESCIHCHDSSSDNGLNLESLSDDLEDRDVFRQWAKVHDRVRNGEMPPNSEPIPDAEVLGAALSELNQKLVAASRERQAQVGRVPARRLTKLELGYTLQDLLLIDLDVTSSIPDEVDAGTFDTVGENQRLSAVHMESFLAATNQALDQAIQLGPNPYRSLGNNFHWLREWHEKPINLGGGVTRELEDRRGIALFRDIDYLTKFQLPIIRAGIHRLTTEVAAFQSETPVTVKLIVKSSSAGNRLVKTADLIPGEPQTLVVDTFLFPGDEPYVTFDMEGQEPFTALFAAGGSANYRGRGLAIYSQRLEGPIYETWPPPSTRQLLDEFIDDELTFLEALFSPHDPRVSELDDPKAAVESICRKVAQRIFRRPVSEAELLRFVELSYPALDEEREFVDALRISLQSMLTSPQFLLFDGEPGELNDYALASRLSYFLWKSMPDDELFQLAGEAKLREPNVLREQVERMLADEKADRFVIDFTNQWLRLNKLNVTTPDVGLYPEFDELLSDAIPEETRLFFRELIDENLGIGNTIDSDFTFVNRRLAEHYKMEGVEGQEFRRVELAEESVRGGLLTQAAILKTTANGTTTSPVTRGNFVLSNIIGLPPAAPPPDVGSIEPDTRGQTTIREILDAHRNVTSCNQCHREIDPPGFALESFDPIGGYRTHYRASSGTREFAGTVVALPPKQGPAVDPSGITSRGEEFTGIDEFKELLLAQKEQIARNFTQQLLVYSTGAEIQFADRAEVETILESVRANDYPVRDILHEVVQSRIFRNK